MLKTMQRYKLIFKFLQILATLEKLFCASIAFNNDFQPCRIVCVETVEGFFCVLDGEVMEQFILTFYKDFGVEINVLPCISLLEVVNHFLIFI